MTATRTDLRAYGLPNTDQYRRLLAAVAPDGDSGGSRYGNHPWAWTAYAVAALYLAEDAVGGMDEFELAAAAYAYAGLTVNDSADIANLLLDYWHRLPRALKVAVGTKHSVRALAAR